MLTPEEKQIHNAVHVELREFEEFKKLVKRTREAQKELDTCSIGDYAFIQHCAAQLESEVDEYLKKMEELK